MHDSSSTGPAPRSVAQPDGTGLGQIGSLASPSEPYHSLSLLGAAVGHAAPPHDSGQRAVAFSHGVIASTDEDQSISKALLGCLMVLNPQPLVELPGGCRHPNSRGELATDPSRCPAKAALPAAGGRGQLLRARRATPLARLSLLRGWLVGDLCEGSRSRATAKVKSRKAPYASNHRFMAAASNRSTIAGLTTKLPPANQPRPDSRAHAKSVLAGIQPLLATEIPGAESNVVNLMVSIPVQRVAQLKRGSDAA